jgi:nitronate monooxygenase
VAAARALGASAVQVGTAYLRCAESRASAPHRRALAQATDDATRVTNVFTGRRARGLANRALRELGPLSELTPPFPLAAFGLAPLRERAESTGSGDFSPLWAGQAAALSKLTDAGELTRLLGSGWR